MLQYGFLFWLKTCMIIHELSEMMILEELGMIIGFVIWSFCAVLFFIVGVVDLKSAKQVGFFTGVKPPKITDVKKYNKAVALLWFITGIVFELIGLPFLFLKPLAKTSKAPDCKRNPVCFFIWSFFPA